MGISTVISFTCDNVANCSTPAVQGANIPAGWAQVTVVTGTGGTVTKSLGTLLCSGCIQACIAAVPVL